MESRYTDSSPVVCQDCNWQGMVSECIHTYKGIFFTGGDVEPVDLCPECRGENLIPIEHEPAELKQVLV